MTIQARKMLVSSSKHSIKCPYIMDADYITYHETYNDATANGEVSYMIGNSNQVSFHYAVDDKEVVQGIPTNRNAWHCGDGGNGIGNRKSIGVEVCYSKSGGDRYKKAEELAFKFIAQLLHERNWGVNKLKQHFHWSKKNCPHRVRAEGRWNEVINKVQFELNKLKKPVSKPQNKEESTLLEKAIVINSSADYGAAEAASNSLGAPVISRSLASKEKLAKELIVIGGNEKGLKADKFTILSGKNRFETSNAVGKHIGLL
jgi:N-acetylmuramoyl-L-alanine amidase